MGEYSLDDYQAMNHTAWAETLYQSDLTIQDTEIVGVRVED